MYKVILTHQDTDILFNMASRQFAYNPTQASISGATLVGTLAVGSSSLDYSSDPGGIDWWMGPEESTGYVIATVHTPSDFPTPVGNVGTVKFWRTNALSDSEFRSLAEYITGQTFVDAAAAKTYLNNNSYWTSWAPSAVTFSQTFTGGQAPSTATENAWTTFRSQLTGSYTSMALSNNLGHSITVTDATKVQDIANALRTATTNTNTTVVIGANTWRIAHGCVAGTPNANSIYLTTGGLCSCAGTYTVRPMIKNANWGGLNGSSCNQPTQTITLTFT